MSTHRALHLAHPVPVYYDDIDPGGSDRPLVVLVHGGGVTGASYLSTPDGRPGWAQDFVDHGYRVIVPDWPGVGRSAAYPSDAVSGDTVAAALGALLRHLRTPVVLVVHSMSGPYGFRMIEEHGEHVTALIAVAPGPPGNIQDTPAVLHETDTHVTVASPSVDLVVPKTGTWTPTEQFVTKKLIGRSTRLPSGGPKSLIAATSPIPSQCLLGRLNYDGRQLRITQRRNFAGLPCLVVTGSADADHPRETDRLTVDWLRGLGADVDYHFLGDHGIEGNGHMLMSEVNSSEVANHVAGWLAKTVNRS
jgi:pimeloyl-ACP methyl ester carboxylesterase